MPAPAPSTLQNSKDPIVIELERIVTTQLVIPVSFIHANLMEAEFGLKALKGQDVVFPACIHVATGKSKNTIEESWNIRREATGYLMLLAPPEKQSNTMDYDSKEVNAIIWRMHQLANNLMYQINRSPYSVNGGISEWTCTDVYSKSTVHLFGQGVEFKWLFDTGTTGYLRNPSGVPQPIPA